MGCFSESGRILHAKYQHHLDVRGLIFFFNLPFVSQNLFSSRINKLSFWLLKCHKTFFKLFSVIYYEAVFGQKLYLYFHYTQVKIKNPVAFPSPSLGKNVFLASMVRM